jgi:hypothetical protein
MPDFFPIFGISLQRIDDYGVRELEDVFMPSEDENGSNRNSKSEAPACASFHLAG